MRRAICALTLVLASPAAAQQPATPPQQQPPAWAQLPRMELERQFAGPLQDTVIQRWRDPTDGTICYIYLPISAAHSAPTQTGYVQYGANIIGSISCMASAAAPAPARVQVKAPARTAAPRQIQPPARTEQPSQD